MRIDPPAWIEPVPPRGGRTVRVLVAQANSLLRAGLRLLLESARGLAVAGECSDAAETLRRAARPDWDVLLLDFEMPDGDGLHMVRAVRRASGRRAILVISERPEEAFGPRAMRAGADGFLSKSAHAGELFRAVQRIAGGGRYVSASLAEAMAAPRARSPKDRLSDREVQILGGLSSGLSGKELARRLGISPKTVCTYRARLLRKLGLKSTADLVRYALGTRSRRSPRAR